MDFNAGLPTLTGEGFELRPLKRSDTDALLALLLQPGVVRWWGAYDAEKIERDFFDPAWAYTYLIIVDGQVAGVDEGIGALFRIGLQQAVPDVDEIEKSPQLIQAAQGGFRQQLPVFQGGQGGNFRESFVPGHADGQLSHCVCYRCV